MANVRTLRRHPDRPASSGPPPAHRSAAGPGGRGVLRGTPAVWLTAILAAVVIILLTGGVDPGLAH